MLRLTSTTGIFSYFSCIFSPRTIFAKRKNYNWRNVILIILCLNSLLLLPVTLYYAQTQQVALESFVPHSLDLLNQDNFQVFQQGEIINHVYKGQSKLLENQNAIVAVLPNKETMQYIKDSKKDSLDLNENEWHLAVDDRREIIRFHVSSHHFELSQLKSLSDLKDFISQQWHRDNFLSFL